MDDADRRAREIAASFVVAALGDAATAGHNIAVTERAIATAIREAVEAREKEWGKWLAETRIMAAEQNFDIESALAGQGKNLSLHDAGQVGFAAAIFVWERAAKERLATKESP